MARVLGGRFTRVGCTAALIGAALAGLPAAAPAKKQAPKKPTLVVTKVAAHAGKRITPGERFRVTGTLRNRGRKASRALLSATLRNSAGRTRFVLGSHSLRRVKGRHTRKFTIRATGPARPAGAAPLRYVLVVCVRAKRGARASCHRQRRAVLVSAPATGSNGGDGGNNDGGTGGNNGGGPTFTSGARTAGDRLFPNIGNGGYDVTHYALALTYAPDTGLLQGTATIDAKATQDLSDFSFDLHDIPVTSVLVDGHQATARQEGDKLIVTPPNGIPSGTAFTTTVAYSKTPILPYTDPDGSSEGWVATSDGAFVVNEPVGAMSWFPSNNVPTDKATYDLHITVPQSLEVVGSGRLVNGPVPPTSAGATRTWHWVESQPMASYLVTATNGEFDFTPPDASQPTPAYYAVDSSYTPVQKAGMQSDLGQTPSIIDFYKTFLSTPYPYDAMGGVIDKGNVGYALETQTKPMYDTSDPVQPGPGLATISHENAHQWFGDDVSPATWSDIWLNEGPAEFFSWLWQERSGNSPLTTMQQFTTNYNNPNMNWSIPPAAPPTAADMFDTDAMYTRGAMTMEALREIAGEDKFKAVLHKYLAEHQYGNASTRQFIDLWKTDSGKDPARLEAFFQQWLYGTEKPTITPSNF